MRETVFDWFRLRQKLTPSGKKYTLTEMDIHRLDLVAYKVYGYPDLHYYIQVLNNKTIFEFEVGEKIDIPKLTYQDVKNAIKKS